MTNTSIANILATRNPEIKRPRWEHHYWTNFWLAERYDFIPAAMARYLFHWWGQKSGSLIISDEHFRERFDWLTDEQFTQARDRLDKIRGLHFKAYGHVGDSWEVNFLPRLATRLQKSEHFEIFDSGMFVQFNPCTAVFYAQVKQVCEKILKLNPKGQGAMGYQAKWHWQHRLGRCWSPEEVEMAVSELVNAGYLQQPFSDCLITAT